MGKFVVKQMIVNGSQIKGATVNVLGLTFKKAAQICVVLKVFDLFELGSYGVSFTNHDPVVDQAEAYAEYGIMLTLRETIPSCRCARGGSLKN